MLGKRSAFSQPSQTWTDKPSAAFTRSTAVQAGIDKEIGLLRLPVSSNLFEAFLSQTAPGTQTRWPNLPTPKIAMSIGPALLSRHPTLYSRFMPSADTMNSSKKSSSAMAVSTAILLVEDLGWPTQVCLSHGNPGFPLTCESCKNRRTKIVRVAWLADQIANWGKHTVDTHRIQKELVLKCADDHVDTIGESDQTPPAFTPGLAVQTAVEKLTSQPGSPLTLLLAVIWGQGGLWGRIGLWSSPRWTAKDPRDGRPWLTSTL